MDCYDPPIENIAKVRFAMKRRLFGLLLAAGFAASAQAAIQTVDAGTYTFSYDDSFWGLSTGTSFARAGNTFTFGNLGYEVEAIGGRRGIVQSGLTDSGKSVLSISAKSGYVIDSVSMGMTGVGQVSAPVGAAAGTDASAQVQLGVGWYSSLPYTAFYQNPVHDLSLATASGPGVQPYDVRGTWVPYSYYPEGTVPPGASLRPTSASLEYFDVSMIAMATPGAYARATQDTTYFTVQVSAVPEPESYAMFLAGLGFLGVVVSRRSQRA